MISGLVIGVVKVWDIWDNFFKFVMSLDEVFVDLIDVGVIVKLRCVCCLIIIEEIVYWGDDGVNIKVMDLKLGIEINMMLFIVCLIVLGFLEIN